MKIEHEISVRVVRYRTIKKALVASFKKGTRKVVKQTFLGLLPKRKMTETERELAEILHQPLLKGYEGESVYERTLALTSVEKEIEVRDFYQQLAELEYYPASISEGLSFMRTSGVEVDKILHLGTCIRNEKFLEKRLLTRKNGVVELEPFFPATKLKPHYHIVVVKKEKIPQK
ncbi:hypothetical protein A3A36_01015 [Candidatus Kaiserbacteria bacterium RIFCSPLOWO2_01_FULL_52_12b]|uniref:Uncharacterized protein n=1 Tax=Candidatus Kaiserbacteria bacterium RIFCSPLOWO2_01_FULL_52_12b TaxID=1798509 RepID=A0A1F6EYF1_9BACT|nr:MAG: hypothetical protein A3A36_01015 [Candidatus Kaiserbacteria bacterium RIFCSPLOWO2_01_FULL_52_12b]